MPIPKIILSAIEKPSVSAVEKFVKKGKCDYKDKDGCDLLWYAMDRVKFILYPEKQPARIKIVKLLISSGINVNIIYKKFGSFTPLIFAASDGSTEYCDLLIEGGAQINGRDQYGATPLHRAALNGKLEVVKLLLKRGADKSLKTFDGDSTLNWAIDGKMDTPYPDPDQDYNKVIRLLK
jgi:ankyrin repeat protein